LADSEIIEIKVCPALDLYGPDGSVVHVTKVRNGITFVGGQLAELRLLVELDWATWQRIDKSRWFHLEDDARGPIFGGEFKEGQPIELEATLKRQSLPLVAISTEDVWDIGALFLDATPDSELLKTESWFAQYVKQDTGIKGLKSGMQTKWAPT
jgi:hypothetical protein